MPIPNLSALLNRLRRNDPDLPSLTLRGELVQIANALKNNETVRVLRLHNYQIRFKEARAVAKILETSPSLRYLDLTGCNIGDEGTQRIALALKENTSLQYLNLTGCNIGAEGNQYIAQALKINKFLRSLYLRDCKIGNIGAQRIALALEKNVSLELLDLTGCSITDVGIFHIAKALKKNPFLRSLNVTGCNITDVGTRYIANFLKTNSPLESLNLTGCNITYEGARCIAESLEENDHITSLRLGTINSDIQSWIDLKLKANQIKAFMRQLDNNILDTEYLKKHTKYIVDILNDPNNTMYLRKFSDIIYSEFFTLIGKPLPAELYPMIPHDHNNLYPLIEILCDEWDTGIQSRINDKATHIYNGRYPRDWNDLGNTKIVSTLLQRASSWMNEEELYEFGCKLAKSSLPEDHLDYREIIESLPDLVQQGFDKPTIPSSTLMASTRAPEVQTIGL